MRGLNGRINEPWGRHRNRDAACRERRPRGDANVSGWGDGNYEHKRDVGGEWNRGR